MKIKTPIKELAYTQPNNKNKQMRKVVRKSLLKLTIRP